MTVPDDASDPPLRGQKSVLICQACRHESHVDGDWVRRRRGDLVAVQCPECGYEVAHRPCNDDEQSPRRRCEPSP